MAVKIQNVPSWVMALCSTIDSFRNCATIFAAFGLFGCMSPLHDRPVVVMLGHITRLTSFFVVI
jgi:hypothetical protein